MASDIVYAVEVSAHNGTSVTTLYFASTPGFTSTPSDTPANTQFSARLITPGNFQRFAFASYTTGGASQTGKGAIELNNADGKLDAMKGYGYGRTVILRKGTVGSAYPSAWTTVFVGVVEQIEFSLSKITLLMRDRQAQVANLPFQPTKYAGTNALPAGVEGVATDIKGQPKVVTLGQVFGVTPKLVNTSQPLYQVDTYSVASIDAVYDRAVAMTVGAAQTSLANLIASTPTAGTFNYYLGTSNDGAYFKPASAATGTVTCDITQGAVAGNRTVAQLVKGVLKTQGGLVDADLDLTSFTALDALCAYVVGVWVDGETTVGAVLDQICASIGAYWGIKRSGLFSVGQITAPSGTSVKTFYGTDLIDLQRVATKDPGGGQAVYRVVIGYAQNYTVQSSDIGGAVTQARRNVITQPYATVVAEDLTVRAKYPLAVQISGAQIAPDYLTIDEHKSTAADTCLVSASDAAAEAARRLALYKTPRDLIQITVAASKATSLELMDVVTLNYARYDWTGGKQFRILGFVEDYENNLTQLTLWG